MDRVSKMGVTVYIRGARFSAPRDDIARASCVNGAKSNFCYEVGLLRRCRRSETCLSPALSSPALSIQGAALQILLNRITVFVSLVTQPPLAAQCMGDEIRLSSFYCRLKHPVFERVVFPDRGELHGHALWVAFPFQPGLKCFHLKADQ